MKNKESQMDDYNETITLNLGDNQSISQAPEIKVPVATSSGKKTNKRSRAKPKTKTNTTNTNANNTFNAPANKKQSNNNVVKNNSLNINISLPLTKENPLKESEIVDVRPELGLHEEKEDSLIKEYKELRSEYKQVKSDLEINPNDELKVKYKKKLKKRIKQLKEMISSKN
jgi:hypothetical protein